MSSYDFNNRHLCSLIKRGEQDQLPIILTLTQVLKRCRQLLIITKRDKTPFKIEEMEAPMIRFSRYVQPSPSAHSSSPNFPHPLAALPRPILLHLLLKDVTAVAVSKCESRFPSVIPFIRRAVARHLFDFPPLLPSTTQPDTLTDVDVLIPEMSGVSSSITTTPIRRPTTTLLPTIRHTLGTPREERGWLWTMIQRRATCSNVSGRMRMASSSTSSTPVHEMSMVS